MPGMQEAIAQKQNIFGDVRFANELANFASAFVAGDRQAVDISNFLVEFRRLCGQARDLGTRQVTVRYMGTFPNTIQHDANEFLQSFVSFVPPICELMGFQPFPMLVCVDCVTVDGKSPEEVKRSPADPASRVWEFMLSVHFAESDDTAKDKANDMPLSLQKLIDDEWGINNPETREL